MLNYNIVKNWPFQEVRQACSPRDAILYALGIGIGADPLDRGQLRFAYEKDLAVVPSMAAILCSAGMWMRNPKSGIDYTKIVHGEQDVIIHAALPTEGVVKAITRVTRIVDKGAGKGAVVEAVRELYDDADRHLASVRQVTFGRGDGGYMVHGGQSDEAPEALPAVPETAPDMEVVLQSLPQAALIYRLSGDWNPLHSDPDVASRAGFPRPILHGLCTYGMATHAVLKAICDYEPSRLKRMAVRFSSPVFPGERLKFQFWRTHGTGVHFRARIDERDVIVLSNGWCELT